MSLQGNLIDLPLMDLLQIFSVQNKKGVLVINHSPYEAVVCFEVSGLWAAFVYQNKPQGRNLLHQGEEAIYTIINWEEGDFRFELNWLPVIPRNIFVNASYLVLEQCRRQDEQVSQKHLVEIANRIPHLIPNPPARSEINLSLEEWRILLQVNGVASVTTIANNIQQPLKEVVTCLESLERRGLVELNKIANFVPKAQSNYDSPSVMYYERATGTNNVVRRPAYQHNHAAPALAETPVVAQKPAAYAKPKVQLGLLSGIMAKIRGL